MNGLIWTKSQIKLLWSDMSNVEIAKKTRHTLESVRWKRYKVTGHYSEMELAKEKRSQNVNRIYMMAKEMGIKIGG